MKYTRLMDIIREVINEELEEGKWDYPKDIRTPKKPDKYLGTLQRDKAKEARKAHRKAVKAKAHAALTGTSAPKVKNPSTGTEILATTAYKAGPKHPAYAAAKAALKKEIVEYLKESTINFTE